MNDGELARWWIQRLSRAGLKDTHELCEQLGLVASEVGYRETARLQQAWARAQSEALSKLRSEQATALGLGALVLDGVTHALGDEQMRRRAWKKLESACEAPHKVEREGAAMGLRVAAFLDPEGTLEALERWTSDSRCSWWRAAVLGLSSALVIDSMAPELLDRVWEIDTRALEALERSAQSKGAACDSLRKALGEGPSLLVMAAPGRGFEQLGKWADGGSEVSRRVVASNLRKARLRKGFPDEVQDLGWRLTFP